jgi:hypothetical protein
MSRWLLHCMEPGCVVIRTNVAIITFINVVHIPVTVSCGTSE